MINGPQADGHPDLPDLEYRENHSIGLRLWLLTPAKRSQIQEASKLRISSKTDVDAFKRIDANRFIAVIYRNGKSVSRCKIMLGGMFGRRIPHPRTIRPTATAAMAALRSTAPPGGCS